MLPKILLIEQDRGQRDAWAHWLEGYGYEVSQAADDKAGLERLLEDHPKLIFLDFEDEQASLSFARTVRQDSKYGYFRYIPIG